MIHYNYQALRERYLVKKRETPIWTDEKYCIQVGCDPALANTRALREVFINDNEDPVEAAKIYDNLLAENGLTLNHKDI